MKHIVITHPTLFTGEEHLILSLFSHGLDTLHLRKPEATREEVVSLLKALQRACHDRGLSPSDILRHIVVHDYHDLCPVFGLQGIHLNRRNPTPPAFMANGHYPTHFITSGRYTLSASCHTLQEVRERKPYCDYVFLSPIFDSISKQGYASAFMEQDLRKAAAAGIIDNKVVALGGITKEHIHLLYQLHFGGAALLGDVWRYRSEPDLFALHWQELLHAPLKDS